MAPVYYVGAGTFDATVVRRGDASGLDIDAAVVAHLGATLGTTNPRPRAALTHPADAGQQH